MAIRKSTMQEQVTQAIAQINPDDRPIATFHTVTGPSPWLTEQFGLIAQAFVKYYFFTVTEQAVVIHKAGRVSARPKELVVAIPRHEAGELVSNVKRKMLWSSLPVPTARRAEADPPQHLALLAPRARPVGGDGHRSARDSLTTAHRPRPHVAREARCPRTTHYPA